MAKMRACTIPTNNSSPINGSEATNDEHDLDHDYLDGQISGVLSFMAPFQPGSYDFRLHETDNDGQEVASVTFQVAGD